MADNHDDHRSHRRVNSDPPGDSGGGGDESDADAGDRDSRDPAEDRAVDRTDRADRADRAGERPGDDGGPDLERLRGEVEAIDRDLVGLIARRTYLAEAIAAEKERRDLPTVDERRERRVLDRAAATADLFDLDPDRVRTVFRELIELNKHEQQRRRSTDELRPAGSTGDRNADDRSTDGRGTDDREADDGGANAG